MRSLIILTHAGKEGQYMTNHDLFINDAGRQECRACGVTWKTVPISTCVGVPVYGWGAWGADLFTKKQLAEKGYHPGKPAGACYREKSPNGIMWLYRVEDAKPKATRTEAQLAAAKANIERARPVDLHCSICGRYTGTVKASQVVPDKAEFCFVCLDGYEAHQWATALLERDFIILDTETTGLRNAEAIEIAIINSKGETLLNTRVKPSERGMKHLTESGAIDIHGIKPEMLQDAPLFADVYPQLAAIINGRELIIYNLGFDLPILDSMCGLYGLPALTPSDSECAMEMHAQWYGEWSNYWHSYKWQKLDGGHDALGDCLATLRRIKGMAADHEHYAKMATRGQTK
jgi:DNA polymerase III subunit epsilon